VLPEKALKILAWGTPWGINKVYSPPLLLFSALPKKGGGEV